MNDLRSDTDESNDGNGFTSTKPRPVSSGNDDSNVKKKRLRREIESLHQEMEVTGYAKGKMGHRQRKIPRDVSKVRTRKRKLLEKLDDKERAILGEEDESDVDDEREIDDGKIRKKRLRGSRAAAEESVIRGSLIFQTTTGTSLKDENNYHPENSDVFDGEGMEDDDDNNNDDNGDEEEEADTEEDEGNDTDTDVEIGDELDTTNEAEKHENETINKSFNQSHREASKQQKTAKPGKSSGPTAKKRRKMYRLRNFQSFKMAQKHGDALAAHTRGQHQLAIEQLKAVAKAAPSAPQVYSSLGMVYEDMLKESRKRYRNEQFSGVVKSLESKEQNSNGKEDLGRLIQDSIPDSTLANQQILATKAYGSHHVAAILCKKDFTLWVRAGDSAISIAEVHYDVMKLPKLSKKLYEYHNTESRRWQNEALRDYIAADNLKPPGIDVPAKVALMHMKLGNLSEALTILTDLKNRSGYDFQCSYKAWMLYSDLMLRLGHECLQWNKGIQTNENYMFRRWLRKFSKIFDWQERRLQALSLAFEAAAGTKNTTHFLKWIRKRMIEKTKCPKGGKITNCQSEQSVQNEPQINEHKDHPEVIDKDKKEIGSNECIMEGNSLEDVPSNNDGKDDAENAMTRLLQKEKKLMIFNQSQELESFDKTTSEMDLPPQSGAAKDREAVRNVLLRSHDVAINGLLKDYSRKEVESSLNSEEEEGKIVGMNADPLPMSGSITQVCSIASELMKHLLGLELYEGANHVGDAVSFYMKERARRNDVAIEAKRKADEWQQKVFGSPFFLDSYDDDSIAYEENDSPYLSDEDTLLNDTGDPPLIESLRKGALTPELNVLYGLALVGQGGRNFIAAKCLRAIEDLQQEDEEWFSSDDSKIKHDIEPFWILFRKAMTEELYRTGAFAFVADVLKKTNKEHEWAFHFAPLFRHYVEQLKHRGLIDKLLGLKNNTDPNLNFKKNQLLKVILEACKFEMYSIEETKNINHALNKAHTFAKADRAEIAQSVLASMVGVVPLVWSVEGTGILTPTCIELVKVLAKCIKWISTVILTELPYSVLKNIVEQCTTVVSYLCGNSVKEFSDVKEGAMEILEESDTFPIQSSWQPTELRMLSICTYNFAVACNVSLFSGWENEEFTMNVLKKRQGAISHFGVHIGDRRLAGCLPSTVENELNRLWIGLARIQPTCPRLDFATKIKTVKESDWFQAEIKTREETLRHGQIATYGEVEALELFIGYAAMCTHLSQSETDKRVSARSQQMALSIMLPLSQFCLDETLWDSDIGDAAATLASYEEWQIMAGRPQYQSVGDREGLYPKRIRKSGKKLMCDKKVQEWIEGAGSPTSKDFIPIPNVEFKKMWTQESCSDERTSETNSVDAKGRMKIIHKTAADLRGCYTYAAAEKACLNLSIALLEMASEPACRDPFHCLQQAALFASQAAKSGNSDTPYRQSLPEMNECSPREALTILGRADCLQAVYFPNEAAYLCSFVARVCRLHRDSREVKYKWNDRWKIVGVYAYNVSVMIRITVSNVMNQTMQKTFMTAWERDVVEELERGRRDGRSWINSLKRSVENVERNDALEYDSLRTQKLSAMSTEDNDDSLEISRTGMSVGETSFPPSIHRTIDSRVQFEPEELNQKVMKLLRTQIDEGDEDCENLNEVVQYSV